MIESYGENRFRVGGETYQSSILVFPDETTAWPVASIGELSIESLLPVTGHPTKPDILIMGCGSRFTPPQQDIVSALREHGISLEWMDTGAACRTFNVLLAEGRSVAAALIAVE